MTAVRLYADSLSTRQKPYWTKNTSIDILKPHNPMNLKNDNWTDRARLSAYIIPRKALLSLCE
jgi:hypothetical protein